MDPVGPKALALFARRPCAIFICMALLLTGCNKEKVDVAQPPPTVAVVTVNPKDVPVIFEYVAQTQSSHLVNIHARVNGFLDRRVYTEGSMVKEGQTLFLMDAKPFKAQLDQAEASLAQQNASLVLAKLNLDRNRTLAKQDVVAQKDLDDAVGQYETAVAAVQQAKAQVETARLNLSYTTITTPVTGMSSFARQTDGTYINPQNSLLTEVAVLSPMWVNFSISENELQHYQGQIAKGQMRPPPGGDYVVEVILVDGSVFPYTGRITFAEPSYNLETGTFLIRTSVENPDNKLRPNQFVHIHLKGAIQPAAILVPQRAVQEGAKGQFVWVVNKAGAVEQRPVTVGNWNGDDWFIQEGLQPGEQVVVDGGLALQPGAKVVVKPYEKMGP